MSAERLDLDELVEHWTLLDGDRGLVAGKRGSARLAFALMLKFYARHGRFPDGDGDLPGEVVEFVARQVQVSADALRGYEFSERHGPLSPCADPPALRFSRVHGRGRRGAPEVAGGNVADADPRSEVVREELLSRCRKWRVEPPSEGRVERIVRAAIHGAQTALCERIVARLTEDMIARIERLLAVDDASRTTRLATCSRWSRPRRGT